MDPQVLADLRVEAAALGLQPLFAAGSQGPGTAVLVALVPMRSQDFGFNRNQERLAAKIQATGNALRGDMPHLDDIDPGTGQIPPHS